MRINRRFKSGFSLVEIVMALGIVSIAFVAIFGMLPLGFTSNRVAVDQTMGTSIAAAIAADLRNSPVTSGSTGIAFTSGTTGMFGIELTSGSAAIYLNESGGPYSASTTFVSGTSRYVAAITTGTTSGNNNIPYAQVNITWPALPTVTASTQYAQGKITLFVTLKN